MMWFPFPDATPPSSGERSACERSHELSIDVNQRLARAEKDSTWARSPSMARAGSLAA